MISSSRPSTNRLKHAVSPYLLQHQHNPVDWFEWGPEALEKAVRERKPIFLSIGYSACHWCHVMAHESFENEAIAAVMNRLFVNIKVDREERPDLDEIYMQATTIINDGQGGWPMSVWLTPTAQPFFAGTYFPPDARWGRPGFGELCERIGTLWREKREALESDAARLAGFVADALQPAPAETNRFTLDAIDQTAGLLAAAFDTSHGGLFSGGTNKFPPSMAMDLMLRSAVRNGYRAASTSAGAASVASAPAAATSRPIESPRKLVDAVLLTLDRMSTGGIYDQLAGGIARYSTDREWLVPHFEKMLYDQALVSRSYIDAWQLTHEARYRRIACEIFDYVLSDMRAADGAFYSARDADSEGEEGKFYVWRKSEIVAALGKEDAEPFCAYFDVSEAGNWSDPHAPGVPKNILHVPRPIAEVAAAKRMTASELEALLTRGREKLLKVRATRTPPALDDKILCEWNGLMIASLARGGAAFGEPRYVDAAARAARCILGNQIVDGRLCRAWRNGKRLESAFLSDYANLIDGLLELYEATFDPRWLDDAERLNRKTLELFLDETDGGFFFTPATHTRLLTRSKDVRDNAVPSGNSVQLLNLLRLAAMRGDEALRNHAERAMRCYAGAVLAQPGSGERFLQAVEFALAGPSEIAIVGDPSDSRTIGLLRAVRESYVPNRIIMLLNPSESDSSPKSPLLAGRALVNGAPALYLCRAYACQRPMTTADEVRAALGKP